MRVQLRDCLLIISGKDQLIYSHHVHWLIIFEMRTWITMGKKNVVFLESKQSEQLQYLIRYAETTQLAALIK